MLPSIYLIGIAQGLLLFIFYTVKARIDPYFYWLSSLILTITIMITGQWLLTVDIHYVMWPLYLLSSGLIFLIGPLLYLFIKNKITKKKIEISRLAPHLIPIILYFITIIILITPYSEQKVNEILVGNTDIENGPGFPLLGIIKLLHLFVYTYLSFRIVFPKKNDSEIRPFWYFIIGYIFLQGVAWLMLFISILGSHEVLLMTDHMVSIILVLYVYILGYVSMASPGILNSFPFGINKKYKKGGLDGESSIKLFGILTKVMNEEKPYLNPNLNLQELANLLSIKPHHLSQIINENAHTNFSDYINGYRVEKVKDLLIDDRYKNYTLLAIAFEAGFNNKNSFNAAFKKYVGTTPTAYRKAIY